MKKIISSVFFILFVKCVGLTQVGLSIKKDVTPQYKRTWKAKNDNFNAVINKSQKPKVMPLPQVFSVETLPFFCKIEHKMGLNQKVPLKFRLGSVQYVDELEGKGR